MPNYLIAKIISLILYISHLYSFETNGITMACYRLHQTRNKLWCPEVTSQTSVHYSVVILNNLEVINRVWESLAIACGTGKNHPPWLHQAAHEDPEPLGPASKAQRLANDPETPGTEPELAHYTSNIIKPCLLQKNHMQALQIYPNLVIQGLVQWQHCCEMAARWLQRTWASIMIYAVERLFVLDFPGI